MKTQKEIEEKRDFYLSLADAAATHGFKNQEAAMIERYATLSWVLGEEE